MTNLTYTSIIYPTNYRHKDLTLEEIYQAISSYLKIPDYKTKCRERRFTYARHLFCFMCRMYTPLSWKAISDHIGGRDHTTAIHSVHTLKNWLETDPEIQNDVSNIKAIINEKRNYAITERRKIA